MKISDFKNIEELYYEYLNKPEGDFEETRENSNKLYAEFLSSDMAIDEFVKKENIINAAANSFECQGFIRGFIYAFKLSKECFSM